MEFRLANPWFRLYSEFADDAKVQMMSEPMQRRLVMLMCLRCKDATLHATQLAFYLRISASELADTKEIFIENGFIDVDWELVNWNCRQFVSDSSTERVRRSRQRKKQYETLQDNAEGDGHKGAHQECNFAPTAPDTEQSRKQKKQAREAVEVLAEETLQRAKALVSACSPSRACSGRAVCGDLVACGDERHRRAAMTRRPSDTSAASTFTGSIGISR